MAGNVVIRQVWQHNLEEEFERMTMIIPTHRYTGIDTEFPGSRGFPGLSEMAKMAENMRGHSPPRQHQRFIKIAHEE